MIGFIVQSDSLRSERTNFDTLDATRHPDPRARAHTASHTAKYRLHADPSRTEKSMGICRDAVAPRLDDSTSTLTHTSMAVQPDAGSQCCWQRWQAPC
jgi:hypothetical protein